MTTSEEETRYVQQNRSLMEQIERSLKTHREGSGYEPSLEELDAIDCDDERIQLKAEDR